MSASKSYAYGPMEFKKQDLIDLARAGEGRVMTREPNPNDLETSTVPYHLSGQAGNSLRSCSNFIIYYPGDSPKVKYNMANLKSLPVKWFVESICKFELLDPKELGLVNPAQ